MKKSKIILFVLFLLTAFASYHLTVFVTPYVVQLMVKKKSGNAFNVPYYSDVVTDKQRTVVMPNPDFIYNGMGYDLGEHSIRITGVMPDSTYCSIAFYSSDTRNYFVKNDRETPSKKFDLILTREGKSLQKKYPDSEIIFSTTRYGTMLMRFLITDTSRINYLKTVQHSMKVELIE